MVSPIVQFYSAHCCWVANSIRCPQRYRWVGSSCRLCVTCVMYWQEMCRVSIANRWLPTLQTLVNMTISLWRHHQTNWCVRSAFLYLVLPTKWHAVGESTAKPVWMNTRNAPPSAQTAGKGDRTFLTPEASELQLFNYNDRWSFFSIGEQEIKSLKVMCSNYENGCGWVGELQSLDNHLTMCEYTLLHCPKKCMMESNKKVRRVQDVYQGWYQQGWWQCRHLCLGLCLLNERKELMMTPCHGPSQERSP